MYLSFISFVVFLTFYYFSLIFKSSSSMQVLDEHPPVSQLWTAAMVTCEALKPGESTQLAAVSVASLASAPPPFNENKVVIPWQLV